MKIAVILAYEDNPYAGVVRPFINWAKQLREEKNYEVEFLVVEVGPKIVDVLSKLGFHFYDVSGSRNLSGFCKERGYEIIFTDDYIKRLTLLEKIRGGFKKVVYIQVLYGIHSVSAIHRPISLKERMIFSAVKFIPFSILKQRYTTLLKEANVIISNSQTTNDLAHMLYGIESNGVVYPPVDTEIFKPHRSEKTNQAMLYLGSQAGDTDKNFVKSILKVLEINNFEALIMGNKILEEKFQEYVISRISNVSDEKLAEVYSKCKLVICPQKWEQFGYVPVESMACGTPVLSLNYMGPKESIVDGCTGWLAKNNKELLHKLNLILRNETQTSFDSETIRQHVIDHFSIITSVKRLTKFI
jgi:glycosyltransferase involved in cell wall biosynthesis